MGNIEKNINSIIYSDSFLLEALIQDSCGVIEINITKDQIVSFRDNSKNTTGQMFEFLQIEVPCSYTSFLEKLDQLVDWLHSDATSRPDIEVLKTNFKNNITSFSFPYWIKSYDGHSYYIQAEYTLTKDKYSDDIIGLIVNKDQTAQKDSDAKKARQLFDAYYIDPITKGWNRVYFDNIAKNSIQEKPAGTYSFVTLDIEGFALINDLFGIDIGNKVLQWMQNTLQQNIGGSDLLCRHTNDIFEILMNNQDSKIHDKNQWTLIFETLSDVRNVKGLEVLPESNINFLRVKIGVYEINNPSEPIILIRDKANIAKKSPRAEKTSPHVTIGYYSAYELEQKEKEDKLSRKMDGALKNHHFVPYLQPKINLKNGCVTGAEALVRWIDPEDGIIQPKEFIPIMEKNEFILKVDMFIFEECCKLIRSWIDRGINPIRISSNFSRLHLKNDHFIEDLLYITEKYDVSPCYLEIELTETIVFEDLNRINKIDTALREAGFLFSIDDFGSGYSCLNMLSELNVDVLKLDSSFFGEEYYPDSNKQYVIESFIRLGQDLGSEVVVEGVENEAQLRFLCQSGCDLAQGYVVSRPISVEEFEKKYIFQNYCWEDIRLFSEYLIHKKESERIHYENFNTVETQSALSDLGRFVIYFDIKTCSLSLSESYAARYGLPLRIHDVLSVTKEQMSKYIKKQPENQYEEFIEFIRNIYSEDIANDEREFQFFESEDKYYWERFSWSRVYDDNGEAVTAVILIDDTTERHIHELEDRYASVLIADALKRAESANQIKHEFLTHMSHDIRTPLNGIMGMTEIAKRNCDDPKVVLDALEKISVSSSQLITIVNSILDVKYLDNETFTRTSELTDIKVFHNELFSYARSKALEKNISIITHVSQFEKPMVMLDTIHVRQILVNIINNAIQYSNQQGKVEIIVEGIEDTSKHEYNLTYIIQDNGIGMSKKFVSEVFEPFSKERDVTPHDYDGVGLGLTIAKQLIDFLYGTISIDSQVGDGTKVTVKLNIPLANDAVNDIEVTAKDNTDISGMNILVAEDNEINMEIITAILEDLNTNVVQAKNGLEAVELFANSNDNEFDIILMDIMMPEMNGIEAAKAIRKLSKADAKTIPIIAITANIFAEDVNNAMAAGMNEHLNKPVVVDKLITRLQYYYHRE